MKKFSSLSLVVCLMISVAFHRGSGRRECQVKNCTTKSVESVINPPVNH